MGSKIIVEIDDAGRVQADFIAFAGRTCEEAERRLRQSLAQWGIQVKGRVIRKPPELIAHENAENQQMGASSCPRVRVAKRP